MKMQTQKKKRSRSFGVFETKILLQFWSNPELQKMIYVDRNDLAMDTLAQNMLQAGYRRTPTEICTRLRNLRYVYKKIKAVNPSGKYSHWPHFNAMDAICSKVGQKKIERAQKTLAQFPRLLENKVDININNNVDSWATNDRIGSEISEKLPPLPTLTPAPSMTPETSNRAKQIHQILPIVNKKPQNHQLASREMEAGGVPLIPVVIILFNHPQLQPNLQDIQCSPGSSNRDSNEELLPDLSNSLKNIPEMQKKNLNIGKQQLEKQRQKLANECLEFDRVTESQLLMLVPKMKGIPQHMATSTYQDLPSTSIKNDEGLKHSDIVYISSDDDE